jgi:curli production assembly/transport component CsgG
MPPKVSEIAYKPMTKIVEPAEGMIVLAVYQFVDLTGQQKPNTTFGEISKAVTQGSSNLLIKALKDVGDGKWFRVVERESLQSLLQERKLIRTTRQITQGDKAKPLGPMLYAGAYLTGGIIGYDSNTLTGGVGYRFLGIGSSVQYRQDTVTVMIRLINVVSGEIELAIMVEKTIMSVGAGGDKFKYLDLDTQLLEVEAGVAVNEPVTYAVRKTIEGAVVEMIRAGEVKGLWKYKPEPWKDPGKILKIEVDIPTDTELLESLAPPQTLTEPEPEVAMEGADGSATITEEEIAEVLEILIESNNEIRETVKEKASQVNAETTPAPQSEQVDKPVKVKVEPPLSDGIVCESSIHHFGCTEVTNEETITSTDTTTDTDRR